ncbi:hypothetical protein HOY80DRAFT_414296 [Tuber brumale]|nr:hypothetical protein HOY80DRAFT_414296 [Tuber brumale]
MLIGFDRGSFIFQFPHAISYQPTFVLFMFFTIFLSWGSSCNWSISSFFLLFANPYLIFS